MAAKSAAAKSKDAEAAAAKAKGDAKKPPPKPPKAKGDTPDAKKPSKKAGAVPKTPEGGKPKAGKGAPKPPKDEVEEDVEVAARIPILSKEEKENQWFRPMHVQISSLISRLAKMGPAPEVFPRITLGSAQIVASHLARLPMARLLIMQSTGAGKTIAQLLTGDQLATEGVTVYYVAPPNARGSFIKEIMALVEDPSLLTGQELQTARRDREREENCSYKKTIP